VRRIRKEKENNDKSFLLSVPSSQFSFCGKVIADEHELTGIVHMN